MIHGNQRPLRCIVIGAGVSGVLCAIKLIEAGHRDVTVFEKAHRVGGTWRDNRYPGVACDIPSHLYSYSFAPNPHWTHRYAPGHEILEYIEAVARRFDVLERVRFGEEVTRCEFISGRWHIDTSTGHRDIGDVLFVATGVTHHPHIPEFPGLDSFAGTCVHSARWPADLDITGTKLGIIGTGSSAVQIVSASVPRAASVALFQRTPQWIMPQENPAYTAEETAGFLGNPQSMSQIRAGMERRFVQNFSDAVTDVHSPQLETIEAACRSYLESEVADPVLRERLRPDYRPACKRLVISPDFYRAIQQPNARLVVSPIERMTPRGVRTVDGEEHPLDVLVLATGFRTDRFIRPTRVIGREGVDLDEVWAVRPSAYLCVAVPEFPNFFLLNGPNGPVGNYPLIEVAELQMNYVLQLLELLRSGHCVEISPSHTSAQAFDAARIEQAKNTVWTSGCRSWYLDAAGVPAAWPWSIAHFKERLRAPNLEDFELTTE